MATILNDVMKEVDNLFGLMKEGFIENVQDAPFQKRRTTPSEKRDIIKVVMNMEDPYREEMLNLLRQQSGHTVDEEKDCEVCKIAKSVERRN